MVRAKGKFDKKPKTKRKTLFFTNTLPKRKNRNYIKNKIKIINPRITSFTPQFILYMILMPISPFLIQSKIEIF